MFVWALSARWIERSIYFLSHTKKKVHNFLIFAFMVPRLYLLTVMLTATSAQVGLGDGTGVPVVGNKQSYSYLNQNSTRVTPSIVTFCSICKKVDAVPPGAPTSITGSFPPSVHLSTRKRPIDPLIEHRRGQARHYQQRSWRSRPFQIQVQTILALCSSRSITKKPTNVTY